MNLRSDHPPIFAARRNSGMELLAILMLATAIALWLIPLAMTLKGMAS